MMRRIIADASTLLRRAASTVGRKPVNAADNRFVTLEAREMGPESRRTGVLAFKRGMMSHYDKWGYRHPITVLDVHLKTVLGSFPLGASIIQEVGLGDKSVQQCHHAQLNYYASLKLAPKLHKLGFPVSADAMLPPGTPLRAAHFVPGQLVDVKAKSIGKGFQGAMKKWGFKGMPASHGQSLTHRAIGATGSRSDPGRVFKGKKMAGRMGGTNVTVQRLRILKLDHALNCVFVRGAVPGHDSCVVRITDAVSSRRDWHRTEPAKRFPTFIPDDSTQLPREETAEHFENDPLYVGSSEK